MMRGTRLLSRQLLSVRRQRAALAMRPDGIRIARQQQQQQDGQAHRIRFLHDDHHKDWKRSHSTAAVAVQDDESALTRPSIDLEIAAKIEGEESQIATIQLQPGESLRAESGAMLYMTAGLEMETIAGDVSSAMKRVLTGQNVFVTDFVNRGTQPATLGLGTDFPSKILRLRLGDYHASALICQRGAYLASPASVMIETEFTKSMTAGFFGGQGFILQRLTGEGDVLIKGGGTVINKTLGDGERLRVTSGSLIALEPSVEYDVQMMPGIKNAMFGGEGLFVTTLTGPGQVWLQGMPPDRMIAEIARRIPGPGIGMGIPIPMGGGGGGEVAAGAGGADEAAAASVGGATETGVADSVATSDAAVEADRQATVATSDMGGASSPMDAESPSALFGEAAGDRSGASTMSQSPTNSSTSSFDDSSMSDTSFDDSTSFSTDATEPSFDDDSSSSFGDDFGASESNNMFDDTTISEGLSTPEATDEASSGIFQTLVDLFTGGD